MTVRLEIQPGYAALCIIDNGKGFVPPDDLAPETGDVCVGLLSIRERAALLGGSVNIESAVGAGTRLYVVIPYDAASPKPLAEEAKPS
jgi:signal transduction histidine kinase